MGNVPSESNMGDRLRCYKCHKVLPPCKSFSDYYQSTVHGRNVYVFNGGQYYRQIGCDDAYECEYCFNQPIRDQESLRTEEERIREEEERRREEERWRREEEQKIKEEQQRVREAEEKKRREELHQRLQKSHRHAKEQHEKRQLSSRISEVQESKRHVFISNLDEFKETGESHQDRDELLDILSSKCHIPVSDLGLSELAAGQLGEILSALDQLLFDEWITTPPSLSTLQHTQVLTTELCLLTLDKSKGLLQQSISNRVQSLVETISQSASNVFESFLLTQALYLNLMHFFNEHDDSGTDAVHLAEQWAEVELSAENIFLVEFLGTLTLSLQNVVERVSVFILKMEVECFKVLLSTLTHLGGEDAHSECTEILLDLVQTHQWTPTETVTLLKALWEKYAEDVSVTKVLTLVRVYDISPVWRDDAGRSLVQALDSVGPERFHQFFQKALRKQDESSLVAAIAELKLCGNLDDSVIKTIQDVAGGVLQCSEKAPKDSPFVKRYFKRVSTGTDDIREILSELCTAVFHTKGRWPTLNQRLRWCVLVLTEKSGPLELVGFEEDPCVTAMFAAVQVCMGNKLDIVLDSDTHSEEQIKEWSDFYKHLGVSVNTNMKKTNASYKDVYAGDIVYGPIEDFVIDYFQYGLELMETGNPLLSRGFIIEARCLSAGHNLELSRLKDRSALALAADVLQSLMGTFSNKEMELRHRFAKALFQRLHANINNKENTDTTIVTIAQKLTGEELPSLEVFALTFFETLLKAVAGGMETEKNRASAAGKWCLEALFACAVQLQALATKNELFQMVSILVEKSLWSPVEALILLGTLTDRHHDEGCISIMKILHLMTTYQVSSEWVDENNQSLLQLSRSPGTKNLILHLENSFRGEKEKSTDTLFDEIRERKDVDEQTLEKSYSVVKKVTDWIETGEIEKHTDVQRAKASSHSTGTEDLQEILAVLCNAVHKCKFDGKWWPRATQMISWCFLALSNTGKLLEMGTGEGKSCVIAMFAVLRALRGEKVDVVSSSSVLCQRDAEKWVDFYKYFSITMDTNTNKTEDKDRKACYEKDVVYGTIEAFAADHLRQTFEMKDVRPHRGYQCIIIDEVDLLLLDQGVQLTYLSSPMVSMQHLNIILAMIWSSVSQYGFLSTGHQTFVRGPPASFFKAIFDSINTEGTEITDPIDILRIAEECNIVQKGFGEDLYRSNKEELLLKLKTVSEDAVVDFFQELEQYLLYSFTAYTLDDSGLLCLRKCGLSNNQAIQDLTFVVLENGLCCPLYNSEEILITPIAELILEKIQYTPCQNNKDKISIPGFLRNLVEKKVSTWVQNAFLAMRLRQGREYVVENDLVCPVDFRSTGIVELNKKWGDGLQQFVEIKHQIKISAISIVTNYVSNASFFEKYSGKIYGTTGTLGSKTDLLFLQDQYPNLSACKMPSFNRKKLFEVKGTLKTSIGEWTSEIKHVVMAQISPNSYREGRAALVICETINEANLIYGELKSCVPDGDIIPYTCSDSDSLSKIDKELHPGNIIIATNLAGRGTDIKVSKEVNNNGGLFVILSFLSENARVELQAFGRTARKGNPGSAQVIASTDHLWESLRAASSLEAAKDRRDGLAVEKLERVTRDIAEMKLREDLFAEYCKILPGIYQNTDVDERRAVVAVMNEFWGIWLQTKSEEIEQLKRNELQKSLEADLLSAKAQSQSKGSPSSSIYHYIKFGNIAMGEKQWDVSARLFEKAMDQDESWAAIAFYSHAYCTIKQQKKDYLSKARDDLRKALESLMYLSEECIVCLQLVKMSSAESADSDPTSLETQLNSRLSMLKCFEKNIGEAMEKLMEITGRKRDAEAKSYPVFFLVPDSDEDLQVEAYNLYDQGLKYVFSVEEKPRFSWEGLLVFFLGILQMVGGALIIAFTYGTLAQIGLELMMEGISDCFTGIAAMVTGEFSWKSWLMEKVISIAISLVGFGVGKLIARTFKASMKLLSKEVKMLPKFLSRQYKDGLSTVMKINMKNVAKQAVKSLVEHTVYYVLNKAEEELLKKILQDVKNKIKTGFVDRVTSQLENEPLGSLVDSIILSHLENKQQFHKLMQDKIGKSELRDIFKELGRAASEPFYADLSWQNRLSSSIFSVMDRAEAEAHGKAQTIMAVIRAVHMGTLALEAMVSVDTLSTKFFSNFEKELSKFEKRAGLSETVKAGDLSASDTEMLKEFKRDIGGTISALLADAVVEVFHQKFSSHIVSRFQVKVNRFVGHHVRTVLKSERTLEKIRAGQNNRYISYMPEDLTSTCNLSDDAAALSLSHAKKIRSSETAGTILDVRVLSETTGTRVVILARDSCGKLTKMQEFNPSTGAAGQTVKLIYRPKSAEYPEGHYDVLIGNQTVSGVSKSKSCLFHALARGMRPEASEEEIASVADRLRHEEADALLKHPSQWGPFIQRKEWTEAIRGGDWFMAEGAAGKKTEKEIKKILKEKTGKVARYKKWQNHAKHEKGIGQIINGDHQPPKYSIWRARQLNQNSKLVTAMLEVATNSSPLDSSLIGKAERNKGRELPVVYVPYELHREFASTTSKKFRELLAVTISKDDVMGTFKLTVLGAMPLFMRDNNNNNQSSESGYLSLKRQKFFQNSFPTHTKKLVNKWCNHLEKTEGLVTPGMRREFDKWIDDKKYKDQNDAHVIQFKNL